MLGLLMLMLVQGDAYGACRPEDNPLTLDPPHLVVRHGDPVEVNCTSTQEFHNGMYWTNKNESTVLEEDNAFVIWTVGNLTDWDVQAQCNIKMNETHECSKDLLLTVYKNPDSIILFPISNAKPVMEGSEYQLQCDIINVAPVSNLKVRWYKGNETIQTDSFFNMTKTPVSESSILKINLSREDNGALFTCEALLSLGPEGPLPSRDTHLLVTVNYKPVVECQSSFTGVEDNFNLSMVPCQVNGNPPARVEWYHQGRLMDVSVPLTRMHSGVYEVIATNDFGNSSATIGITVEYAPEFHQGYDDMNMDVAEGSDVSLHCVADGNPPPEIHWRVLSDPVVYENVETIGSQSTLHITKVTNSSTYNCTATNKVGIISKLIHVHVIMTTAPVIATPGVVTTPAALEPRACNPELSPARVVVRYGDPVSVNCSTSSTDHDGMGWEAVVGGTDFEENVNFVTWTVASLTDWTIRPKCYITLPDDQCRRTLAVTLYKAPAVFISLQSHTGPLVEGSEYQLQCDIIDVAPVQKLTVRWYKGNETIQTDSYSDLIRTPVNVSSTINITLGRIDNGAEFRCEAQLDLGPEGPLPLPTVISEPYTTTVYYMPLIQDCPSNYTGVEHTLSMSMVPCQADGNPLPTIQWYHHGKRVNASMLLTRMDSGQFIFEALNVIGRSNTTIDITVEYGPTFTCRDRYEVKENDERNIDCNPEGKPEPQITWFKGGKEVPFLVPFTRHNGGKYSLVATNNHGKATHTLEIDILYAPEFQKGNDTEDVTSGSNVSLTCSAEGNPPPELNWVYTATAGNVRETTERRQRTIWITGATSTNTGVYICTATNKLGKATRSTTLIMRDYIITIISVVTVILVILTFIFFFCCCCRKRHGQYNFLPVRTKDMDGSNIPMTPQSANGHTA